MFNVKRVIMLIALLMGALICYQVGFATGIFVLVIVGMLLELGFWVGIFKWEKSRPLKQVSKQ